MVFAEAFSLTDGQVVLALIGLMGTGMASFFKLINSQNKSHSVLSENLAKNTKQLGRIATANERGNREAEKRNGHLGDLVIQQGEVTKTLAETATKTILEAVRNVPEQHIEHAHVEHQEVHEAVIKEKK